MSLFPPEAEALGFADLNAVRVYYGVADAPWAAVLTQLGTPDLRIMSAIPADALVENVMLARYGDPPSSLTPTHAVQIGLVWRLARRIAWVKGGGPWDTWIDTDPWARPPPAAAATTMAPPAAPKERTLKMSSVIDQSDDSEFAPESLATADRWYQRYVAVMGGAPQEEEDCTVEQLSAWNKRVHLLDLPPYVDLGIWQPFGCRALRQTKFRAWIPHGSGSYIAKELPGPSMWSQWLAAWRVFQTAAIMLDILPLATLQLYERHVEKLVKLYPSAWHLVVLADEKARGEKWARTRLKITADLASGRPAPERWDPGRPWIASLHLLVADANFWEEQVRSPANAWVAMGSRGLPRNPEEKFVNTLTANTPNEPLDPTSPARRSTKERRAAKKQRIQADREELKKFRAASSGGGSKGGSGGKGSGKDSGLKAKDQAGSDLCFSWDAGKGVCGDVAAGAACLSKVKRAHKCRVCLSPGHRSGECPQRA